jgi:hypothetical protein
MLAIVCPSITFECVFCNHVVINCLGVHDNQWYHHNSSLKIQSHFSPSQSFFSTFATVNGDPTPPILFDVTVDARPTRFSWRSNTPPHYTKNVFMQNICGYFNKAKHNFWSHPTYRSVVLSAFVNMASRMFQMSQDSDNFKCGNTK